MLLWNLSISVASSRMWVDEKKFKKFLDENWFHIVEKCDDIIRHRKWFHIFDIPFMFMCWTEETAKSIYKYLSQFEIKWQVQFSWEKIED